MPSPSRPVEGGPALKTDTLRAAPFPAVVCEARRLVRARLTEWDLEPLTDDCALVVSEFVTNALLHATPDSQPPLRVELRLTLTHLFVEVHDACCDPPVERDAAADDESGRGLDLVDHLAHLWGWYATPDGKCVWAVWSLTSADP